jgi:hypothetical protein
MKQNPLAVIVVFALIILLGACQPVPTQIVQESHPINSSSTPTIMKANSPSSSTEMLPASMILGSILTGSGDVDRVKLTLEDFSTGDPTTPLEEELFSIPASAAMPDVVLEGRLKFSAGENYGYKVVRDDLNFALNVNQFQLPDFDIQFVQDGSYLIPVTQGLVYTGHPFWNYIIGPGRIWKENGDHGFVRASFPFTLVERNQNCTHNGVMSFLFDGVNVSQIRYQITQETCLYFKFDLWGQAPLSYYPESISNSALIKEAYKIEVANRLPTLPLSSLIIDFPESRVNIERFGSGITPQALTAYGLVINGTNYISKCDTRYGEYAFCESLRLPSYSTAKSAFAAVALMRLGQIYGSGVYDLLIRDYVPESILAVGDWSSVTFRNALDMATGNYDQIGYQKDEESTTMVSFLDKSETLDDKIQAAFSFTNQSPPGKVWVYHTSDTFLLTLAMNNYLIKQEGSGVDIFNMVRDEVFIPIGLSAGSLTTLRTDNNPAGIPFGGYGLFWTVDDIAKLSLFLNDYDGKLNDVQILEPGLLHEALQKDPENRGLNTTGVPIFKYNHGFWAKEWTSSEARNFTCSFWTPFMSGYGGITVVLMPNGSTFYYFSDNNEFFWYDAITESNKLKPMCQ